MSTAAEVARALEELGTSERAKAAVGYFKTGPGQYGEGDVFIGVTVPEQRKVAKQFKDLDLSEVKKLMHSPIHEQRLTALLILTDQFKRGDAQTRQSIYDFYMHNLAGVNNWDLVDSSAPQIVGASLAGKDKRILEKLARSDNLWERRVAMIATLFDIVNGDPVAALKIADLLLNDQHDLIQKAVGWMLREVGKRCGRQVLVDYLQPRYQTMPRTMLRYSIEHFDPAERQLYLKGLV